MFVFAHGSGGEKSKEKRKQFWNNVPNFVPSFWRNDNVLVLGDLNEIVGGEEVAGIV